MPKARHRGDVVRVAAVGDVHCTKSSRGQLQPMFAEAARSADILILAGDLTDYGLPEEAEVLVGELSAGRIPTVAVLGNHDFESGRQDEVRDVLCEAGVTVLDGESCEIQGVGFAGIKGFAGGFGRGTLGAWGEPAIKQFVQEALDEALKLETALARLRAPSKIAVLHYAPIQETVVGEPEVIFPFLGCSRLEEPFNRYPVTAVVHGHAHRGTFEGRTRSDLPVYNVSAALVKQTFPDGPGFYILEVPTAGPEGAAAGAGEAQIHR